MAIIGGRNSQQKITIQSRLEEIELVDKEIEDWLEQLGIDTLMADRVGLAVHEAVVNAVKHGNNLQVSKKVEVTFGLVGREMVFEVRDEGSGFDENKLPDPMALENIWKESGRGVFFMKKFMDTVDFKKDMDGFRVILRKKLSPLP